MSNHGAACVTKDILNTFRLIWNLMADLHVHILVGRQVNFADRHVASLGVRCDDHGRSGTQITGHTFAAIVAVAGALVQASRALGVSACAVEAAKVQTAKRVNGSTRLLRNGAQIQAWRRVDTDAVRLSHDWQWVDTRPCGSSLVGGHSGDEGSREVHDG